MLAYSVVAGYSQLLGQLTVAALADLWALMTSVEELPPERQRAVVVEAFPQLFDPYAVAASQVSASFYEEVRGLAGAAGSFAADALDAVVPSRWYALAGFGTAPAVFERGGALLAYSLLSGGLTQVLTEAAADTVAGNAAADSVPVGFQRVPAPGCCAWCGMLASRGAAYASEESALRVVGRGVPVPRAGEVRRRRGGVGGGIRPRGARALGEDFHDFCRCRAVPVFADNFVEMQADADRYFDAYAGARDQVNKGLTLEFDSSMATDGSLKNAYRWVDAGGAQVSASEKPRLIAAAMRADLGVK